MRLFWRGLPLIMALLTGNAWAGTVTKPYTFTANTKAQASQVNSDFDTLYTAINGNVDNANIGPLGIYATQVVPLTTAQAIFGGTVVYAFPAGLTVNGAVLTANSGIAVTGTVNASGQVTGAGFTAGSSQYNATYATVNGTLTATSLVSNNGVSAAGASGLTLTNTVNNQITNDASGDLVFNRASSANSYIGTTGQYVVGSSTYGATSATVNGQIAGLGLVTSAAAYPVASASQFAVGTDGSNAVARLGSGQLYVQNGAGTTTYLTLGAPGLGVGSSSYGPTSATVNGGVLAVTGGTAFTSTNAGDISANRNATSGNLSLGGATQRGTLDFGVSTANQFTASAALNIGSSSYGPTSAAVTNSLTLGVNGTASGTIYLNGGVGNANGVLTGDPTAGALYLQSASNGGAIQFRNNPVTTVNVTLPDAGGITLNRGSLTAGSSTYGPTSASVNGNVTTAGALFSQAGYIETAASTALNLCAGATCSGNYWAINSSNGNLTAGQSSIVNAGATGAFTAGNITGATLNVGTNNASNSSAIFIGNTSTGTNSGHNTQIGTGGSAVAGVTSNVFSIADQSAAWLLAFSQAGSMGIAGSYFSASERRLKNHIEPFSTREMLSLLRGTTIVRYAYKAEHAKHSTHIGFIADDTPLALSPHHKAFDVNAVASTAFAAAKYLEEKVRSLEAQIADLRRKMLPARVLKVAR